MVEEASMVDLVAVLVVDMTVIPPHEIETRGTIAVDTPPVATKAVVRPEEAEVTAASAAGTPANENVVHPPNVSTVVRLLT
jgi:hypothetical protein